MIHFNREICFLSQKISLITRFTRSLKLNLMLTLQFADMQLAGQLFLFQSADSIQTGQNRKIRGPRSSRKGSSGVKID